MPPRRDAGASLREIGGRAWRLGEFPPEALLSAVATMLRTENFRSKVVVDGAESAEYTVGHGLREGAVLSPGLSIGNLTNLGSGPVRTPNRTRVQELRNSDNPNSFMLVKRKEFHVAH